MKKNKSDLFWLSLCVFSLCPLCLSGSFSFAAEPAKLTYADHVLPLLRDKCLGCHNADKARGGLDASTYVKLMEGGSSGAVVKPGDPDDSRLFLLAAHKAEPKMPPKDNALPAEQLALLKRWIEQGALETAGSKAPLIAKKSEVALVSITKGRPAGPPPMPQAQLPQETQPTPRPAAVTALAASPWAPLLAVAAPKQVLLYDSDTLQLIGLLPFPHGQVNVLRFSRNGSLLLAGGGRGGKVGKVVVWNVADGRVLTEVGDEHDAVLAADISADQTQIALGGPGKIVRVYNTSDGQLLREIKKHTDWVTAIEYSPDGVLLATADRSAGLFVWEAFTGREYFGLRGHTQIITGLSWRDDANVLASCSDDGTVRLWEMENGKQIKSWGAHGGGAQSVRFGHDGRLVSCGRDAVTKLWDGNGAQRRVFEGMTDVATRTAFTHDGALVITGDWQGRLRAWATATGKRVGEMTTNPPPPAERLALAQQALADAEKTLAAKEAELAKATAALTSAQAAAQKAAQELAPLQQAADDTATVAKVVAAALVEAKAAADKATAAVQAAQGPVQARSVKAKAFAEAAAKIKDAATKAAANGELQQAATQAQQLAAQAEAELAAAQQVLNAAVAAAKEPTDRLAAAKRAVELTAGPAKAAAAAAAAKQQAAKAAGDAAAAAKVAADRLTAELADARATAARLKAATASAKK
jgi:hypothetical protein